MAREALKIQASDLNISSKEESYVREEEELRVPISDKELMEKVRQSLSVGKDKALEVEKITIQELGTIYTRTLKKSKKRLFARVVARKIPCVDCHDIFYVYSFDDTGEFLKFIPISISKYGNEPWDEDDYNKIRDSFRKKSLSKEVPFNTETDAVTAATISTKLIYDTVGKTHLVIEKLIEMGYIAGKKQ